MFLKRIELQGFKSFADKTIIQFDQPVTGIVGPNGCGKSNVNDAIRWVLGEQSAKSLRSGASMSDIIFAGSQQRKPVNMAKVTLVFDNTARIFASNYDEIEITRQIHRNKDALYMINQVPCRLKDIQDLVMDTGLGRDSLSIISQGNISSFADASPEQRRLLFEEAAGVAKYKKRKKVSLNKLEATQANLERLQDIIDELERQDGPLKAQAEKAKQYAALQQELAGIEVTVLTEAIDKDQRKTRLLEADTASLSSAQLSQNRQLEQLEGDLDALRKEIRELDSTIASRQEAYGKMLQESVSLEKRRTEMEQKREYALQHGTEQEKQAQLAALERQTRKDYEDRLARLKELDAQQKLLQESSQAWASQRTALQSQFRTEQDRLTGISGRLQAVINMLKQPYAHQQGVRAVLQAGIPGIHGTVAQLLPAKEGMGQALQAALSGSVYHIISDDEASARAAISYLKKNRAGRATFLPMSVCSPRLPKPAWKTIGQSVPGAVGWADALVTCQPAYEKVRDRLLANIFVCDNLENANSAARMFSHQVKVVTLEGDIVHAGGSMTGGSVKNNSSPVTLQEDKRALEKREAACRQTLQDFSGQLDKLQRKEKDIQNQLVAIKIETARLQDILADRKAKMLSYQDQLSQFETAGEEQPEDALDDQLRALQNDIDQAASQVRLLRTQRLDRGSDLEQLENQVRTLRREISAGQADIHRMEVEAAGLRARIDQNLSRLNADYAMTYEYACTQKRQLDMDQAQNQVVQLRNQIKKLGSVNMNAPEEYEQVHARLVELSSQKEELLQADAQIRDAIAQMDETMTTQFSDMFQAINSQLQDVFAAMFGGGTAKLVMTDPDNVLETGIDIDVQPPGKLVKNIQTFSGGEKALIAISVLFAILKARTMPLCIFDEVEAALDQTNVERFARYISRFKQESQFIVVTHRPGTMEQCDALYGVTMRKDGVSTVLKVVLEDAVQIAGKEARQ
jgi:chromosome segregation protein